MRVAIEASMTSTSFTSLSPLPDVDNAEVEEVTAKMTVMFRLNPPPKRIIETGGTLRSVPVPVDSNKVNKEKGKDSQIDSVGSKTPLSLPSSASVSSSTAPSASSSKRDRAPLPSLSSILPSSSLSNCNSSSSYSDTPLFSSTLPSSSSSFNPLPRQDRRDKKELEKDRDREINPYSYPTLPSSSSSSNISSGNSSSSSRAVHPTSEITETESVTGDLILILN